VHTSTNSSTEVIKQYYHLPRALLKTQKNRIRTRWEKDEKEKDKEKEGKEKEKEKEVPSPKTIRETPQHHGFFGETIRDGLLVDGLRKVLNHLL